MFFLRKSKRAPDWEEQRGEYRMVLPDGHPVRMVVLRQDGVQIPTYLIDLTLRGARFRSNRDASEALRVDDLVEVVISTDGESSVRTPALIRRRSLVSDGVEWAIEFVNIGNLYGQWDDALGAYFNRRSHLRIAPDLDRPLSASLASKGNRMMATVYDLTVKGVGLLVSHAEATALKQFDPARVSLRLPKTRKELSGPATICQHRRFDDRDVVGLVFDLSDPDGFAKHGKALAKYCAEREEEMRAYEDSWEAGPGH